MLYLKTQFVPCSKHYWLRDEPTLNLLKPTRYMKNQHLIF